MKKEDRETERQRDVCDNVQRDVMCANVHVCECSCNYTIKTNEYVILDNSRVCVCVCVCVCVEGVFVCMCYMCIHAFLANKTYQ